jgi:hemerythrin
MAIEWSDSLLTGVEWQDFQHKELFSRINSLLDAMDMGFGKDEVLRLFEFLDEYFVIHFDAEEQAMHKYDYPDTLAHLEEHTRFIDDIAKLRSDALHGVSAGLVIQVQSRVVGWLINHIGSIDKSLGAFISEAIEKEKEA